MKRCLVIGTINRYPAPDGWEYVHADASDRPIYDLATGRPTSIDVQVDMRDLVPYLGVESFDRIQCWHALEHVNQVGGVQAVSEFYRVLRPGGILDVCVPDLGGIHAGSIEASLTYVYGQQPGPDDIDPELQVHRWGYTEGSLRSLLAFTGFGTIDRKHDGDLHLIAERLDL